MEKKMKIFTQLVTGALACMIIVMYLCFSSCKKTAIPAFHKVIFDTQGGSAISPIGVKPGNSITLPDTPTKAGATFDGWFTDRMSTNSFSETTDINADLTLYAKWNEHLYTVTFDLNGGDGPTISPITGLKYGNNIIFPPEPARADYLFNGWYADKEASGVPFSKTTPITDNVTLYAKWTESPDFKLFSNSFPNGGKIPPKYASSTGWEHPERLEVSPELHWKNPPEETKSFLIIMENISNPKRYTHWTVYAIPVDKRSLAENDPWLLKRNIFWRRGAYQGPFREALAPDVEQTYQIKIYALDVEPDYFDRTNYPEFAQEAEEVLNDHVLVASTIIATW